MIDIHSHILPGIDDGPKKIEMSLDMIRRSYEEGTIDIVATPHFRRGCFEVPYGEVKNIVEHLNSVASNEGIDINIHYGQEVYFSENIIDDLESGVIGTINGGRYMLLEFSMRRIPREALAYMYELKLRGITPIIAHPERYSDVIKNPEILNDFIEEGCLFQLNAASINGFFGRDVKKTANFLLKNGLYSFIGSDAHNDSSRNTGINETCSKIFKKNSRLKFIFMDNSEKLIKNEEIYYKGKFLKKKRLIFNF